MDVALVGVDEILHFGVAFWDGPQHVVQYADVAVSQLLGGLDVLTDGPKVVAYVGGRKRDPYLHWDS